MSDSDESRSGPVRLLAASPADPARERLPASTGISVAEALLTGQESHADRFQRGIRTLLDDGGWNAPTWRIDAAFAVFGSLPLVGVTFDDAYVPLDTVNGAMGGPFAPTSPLNADALLAAHTGAAGATPATRFFRIAGCPRTLAATWHPGTGPTGPFTCPGCGPWTPAFPPLPAWPLQFFCNVDWITNPLGTTCRCISEGESIDPAGRRVP